jgi:hypothetical protein
MRQEPAPSSGSGPAPTVETLAAGDFDAAEAYVGRSMEIHPDLEAVGIQRRIDKARAATRTSTTRTTAPR